LVDRCERRQGREDDRVLRARYLSSPERRAKREGLKAALSELKGRLDSSS